MSKTQWAFKFSFNENRDPIRLIAMPMKVNTIEAIQGMLDHGYGIGREDWLNKQIALFGLRYAHGESGMLGVSVFKRFS